MSREDKFALPMCPPDVSSRFVIRFVLPIRPPDLLSRFELAVEFALELALELSKKLLFGVTRRDHFFLQLSWKL